MKRNFGFTLAEVMIVVAIIGVVAALTIPNVVTKYQTSAQITQLKKSAMDIEQVAEEITTAEGKETFASTSVFKSDEGLSAFLANFDTTNMDCGDNGANCFASTYYSINGDSKSFSSICDGTSVQLSNSASICVNRKLNVSMEPFFNRFASLKLAGGIGSGLTPTPIGPGGSTKPIINEKSKVSYVEIHIDTNGKGAPNIGGRDMFSLYLKTDGTLTSVRPVGQLLTKIKNCLCLTGTSCTCPDEEPAPAASADDCKDSASGEYCYDVLSNNDWNSAY